MTEELRCNCMVAFDPILPPGEHATDCPCWAGVIEYRTRLLGRPYEADECWTQDGSLALDELEALRGLGAKARLDARIVRVASDKEDYR